MNKMTATMVSFVRDEADQLRSAFEDSDGTSLIETTVANSGSMRVKLLRKIHTPITNTVGPISDPDRHYLFSKVFGRPIDTADKITNIEAIAWYRILGAPENADFVRAMIGDISRDQRNGE